MTPADIRYRAARAFGRTEQEFNETKALLLALADVVEAVRKQHQVRPPSNCAICAALVRLDAIAP